MKKSAIILLVALLGLPLWAEKQPFERYQTIIDRMPFGQPPPGFDPNRNPDEVSKDEYSKAEQELTQEQEAIQKAVQFSVINVESDGTVRVGFSDKSDAKTPRHYYMSVGEERDGWVVKEADPVEKTMTIEKDGVEVQLALGENSGGDAGAKGKGGQASRGKGAGAARPVAAGGARSSLLNRPGEATSFKGRRAQREAAEAAAREEAEAREAERRRQDEERAARAEEEKAQREAERAEQREQLKAIQEELRRAREEKAARKAAEEAEENAEDENEEE